MKKAFLIVGLLVFAILITGCPRNRAGDAEQGSNMLIVYYSLSGNTAFAAQYIQSATGADIVELELEQPYSQDYQETLDRAMFERDSGLLPVLAAGIDNIADYDIIFIGSPNWFGTLSLPVLSFLDIHDLSGKTIVPFITHGRGGLQNTVTDLKTALPDSVFLEEFAVAGVDVEGSVPAILEWLERIIP